MMLFFHISVVAQHKEQVLISIKKCLSRKALIPRYAAVTTVVVYLHIQKQHHSFHVVFATHKDTVYGGI